MTQKGDIRYAVNWAPDSMFDCVDDANDGMLVRYFDKFERAIMFAMDRQPTDFFGVTSVHREVCASVKYGWWEEDATWHIEDDTSLSDYDPDAPCYTH